MMEFLSLKGLHRPPPSPRRQTSAQARYITAKTMPRSGFVLWGVSAYWDTAVVQALGTDSASVPAKLDAQITAAQRMARRPCG